MARRFNGTRVLAAVLVCGTLQVSTSVTTSHAAAKHAPTPILGAGSAADAPFLTSAVAAFGARGALQARYLSTSAADGIIQFISNSVDFSVIDSPMTPIEQFVTNGTGSKVLELPVDLSAVAVIYNLPGASNTPLHLDSKTLAGIFMGTITQWNDAKIVAQNPTLALPAAPISPFYRSDQNGSTFSLTNYLTAVNPTWAKAVNAGKTVSWPAGGNVNSSAAMSNIVAHTPGAIGYLDLASAIASGSAVAALKNQSGTYQLPTAASVGAAAARFPAVSGLSATILNAPGQSSYPIAMYSWVVVRQRHANKAHGLALAQLLRWLVSGGQNIATRTHYVALPIAVANTDARMIERMQ